MLPRERRTRIAGQKLLPGASEILLCINIMIKRGRGMCRIIMLRGLLVIWTVYEVIVIEVARSE